MLIRVWRGVVAITVAVLATLTLSPAVSASPEQVLPRVLLFTKVADPAKAHASTPDALDFIEMTGRRYGFSIDVTQDASRFTPRKLARYDVVVWLNTQGDVLNDAQQDAMQQWMSRGGGFVGIHSAAATEQEWDYYHDMVGAFQVSGEQDEPTHQTVKVNAEHQSTTGMPTEWTEQQDQWYRFDRDPADLPDTTILATVPGSTADKPRPVAWCRELEGGGRSWYTALGHNVKSYEDGDYMKMLRGGVWWTAGLAGQPLVRDDDAAPSWPYSVTFLALIAAVASGGALAVMLLNRRESLDLRPQSALSRPPARSSRPGVPTGPARAHPTARRRPGLAVDRGQNPCEPLRP